MKLNWLPGVRIETLLPNYFIDPVTGMEFVPVKGGCYLMGDIFGDGEPDEKPVHEVCLDDFYLGMYVVTQGQWKAIMGINPCTYNYGEDHPVEQVTWNDVQIFIRKLNQRAKEKYRLPTEAEWEYAARSGGKLEKWAGTSNISKLERYAWYNNNSGGWTQPVGQKIPNGLGLYDMNGNVWEWVQDAYQDDAYLKHFRMNPVIESGKDRILRGGSWLDDAGSLRSTTRYRFNPDFHYRNLGFRLARDL